MSGEITDAMPDPESNIQLGEGAVAPAEVLGGDVTTQFTYRPDLTGFDTALAAVKADQEMICGYALSVVKYNPMELADAQGRYVEVFVTFTPEAST